MNEQTEITMAGVAKGITYTSGAGAFLGGVSANDIASWLGIIGVIAGLAMQWYFNRRKDKRETAEHEARMADYRSRQRGSVSKPLLGVVAALSVAVAAMVTPLVAKWEGVRYEPYRDAVGVLTVCYGHTGSDIVPGKRYSKAECDQLLQADLAIANEAVNRCLPMPKLVHVEAALTSAAFNLGPKVVCGSTLQRLALANDWPGACAELSKWKNAGGRELRGLVLRRADERAMCEGRQ